MTMEFVEHLAFVTGGANGIGAQICRDLASGGASVVVADRMLKEAQELTASLPTGDGRRHMALEFDVSKKAQVESALVEVTKTYGRPADLIVNCAGVIAGEWVSLVDVKEEDLDRTMDVNFKGTFLVTQVFGKALLDAKKPGSIVNISSIVAYLPYPGFAPYCASKAAVMQFSKVAAKEFGPKGIRVNSVHPGVIRTAMTSSQKWTPLFKMCEEGSSLRRHGEPKDVSDVVLFLLSSRSAFVTGAQLEVSDVSNVVLFAFSNRSGYVTGTQIEVSGQGELCRQDENTNK